jgi:N-methylhydantoinase B
LVVATAGGTINVVLDAVRTQVIRNAFKVVTEEMGAAVVRSSFSTMIQESVEASAAILDRDARLLSAGQETTPLHSSSLRCGLRSIIEDYPLGTMRPGDVYAMNDPFRGGIHSNDILVFRPVFVSSTPWYFTATLVHVADLGGASSGGLPANVTDYFGEGLLLPPVPLCLSGEENVAVMRVIGHNSRMPANLMGDVRALIAGANVGAVRLEEVLDRFGAETVAEAVGAFLGHSEELMSAALGKIPPGRYQGQFRIEDDGSGNGAEYVVRVAITAQDGRLTVDFEGTSAQATGIINAAYSQALAATLFGIRACVGLDLPLDEGNYRCLDVNLPYGSLVNPRSPAACNGRIVTATAIIEAIVGALATADPGLAMAASGIVHVYTLGGLDDGGAHWGYLGVEMGGSGARFGLDGPDAVSAAMFGSGRTSTDVEPIEARYPVLVERSALWPDSGGPGQWRGGVGTETVVRALRPARVTVRTDRVRLAPPGLAGGLPGRTGGYFIRRGSSPPRRLPGKAMNIPLEPGDALVMRTTGGGGVGRPSRRSSTRLVADVLNGIVTAKGARRDYGTDVPAAKVKALRSGKNGAP